MSDWHQIDTAPLDGTWVCIAAEPFMRDGQQVRLTYTAHWALTVDGTAGGALWSWVDLEGHYALHADKWMDLG